MAKKRKIKVGNEIVINNYNIEKINSFICLEYTNTP
jgi:hypothetical protein